MAISVPFPLTGPSSLRFKIEGDKEVRENLRFMQDHLFPDAMRDALRYVAKGVPVDVSAVIGQYYTLPAKEIKRDVEGVAMLGGNRMHVRMNYRPRTALRYRGRQIGARRSRPGLGRGRGWAAAPPSKRHGFTWQVFRAGPRYFTPYGFVAKGLPFERISPSDPSKLRVIHGPSLGAMFSLRAEYGQQVRGFVGERINKRLYTGLQRGIRRYARWL
ncbi:MAG: hypothetical protein AAFX65_07490 [Cyanobacteria bacterium J06638_7]